MRRREDLLPTVIDRDLDFLKDVNLDEEKKSLTALILATEDTPEGRVAIYGLPITDMVGGNGGRQSPPMGRKAKATGPKRGGRWRTLKNGRRIYIAAPERARNPGHPGRWSQEFAPTREQRMALLEDEWDGEEWSVYFATEDVLSDPDLVEFGELDWEDGQVRGMVNDYANEEWGEWLGGLSRTERDAFRNYATEGYTPINSLLRKGETQEVHMEELGFHFGDREAKEAVEHMDTALSRSPLPTDVVVFRGKRETPGRLSLSIGDEFTDKGFISTSLDPGVAEELFAHDYGGRDVSLVTMIRVPKGTPAGYLSTWKRAGKESYHNPIGKSHESELLLARNLRFRVVDLVGSLSEPGEARMVLEVIE